MTIRIPRLRRLGKLAARSMLLAVAFVIAQGCGPDVQAPDANAKFTPPAESKDPGSRTKRGPGGGTLKLKH